MAAFFDFLGAENPLAIGKYQNRNDKLGMIGVLAFNAIKATRIKLFKQVDVEKTFVIFWEKIKNISGK